MVGVPVIINHKDITADNADDLRVGVVSNVWFDEHDGWYWCDGVIWDETAQNLITNKGWSVSCSYDVKLADDAGGTENNVPYDIEFLDGVFTHLAIVENPRYERANIVFNSKTEFVTVGEGESAHAMPVEYLKNDRVYDSFIKKHSDLGLIENAPPKYTGQTVEEICEYLNITDKKPAIIKTPKDKVIINKDHVIKLVNLNEPSRKEFLNYTLRTLEAPNLILKNGEKHKYIKLFNDNNKTKPHLQIVKVKNDGTFYVTNYRPTKSQVIREINEGQVIYDLSNVRDGKPSANNSITENQKDFNPDMKKHEVQNNKERDMALLDELKKLITKVENDKGEGMDDKEKVENEKVDKREYIRKIMALVGELGGTDEQVRTAAGWAEKISYDKSEAGTADNACDDKKADDKVENKKADNETKEDEKKYEELKKDVKEDAENKCKNSVENAKSEFFDKMNEIFNAAMEPPKECLYVSRQSRLEAAEEYFAK